MLGNMKKYEREAARQIERQSHQIKNWKMLKKDKKVNLKHIKEQNVKLKEEKVQKNGKNKKTCRI